MNPCRRPSARRGLYLITPDEPDTARLLARVAAVLRAGATWLQYRNKAAGDALRARAGAARCRRCARTPACR